MGIAGSGTGRNVSALAHLPLAGILGVVGAAEGIRLGIASPGEDFITGPGGYMTVVGSGLLLFAVLGAIASVLRRARGGGTDTSRGGSVPTPLSDAETGRSHDVKAAGVGGLSRPTLVRLSFAFCVVYVLLIRPLGFTLASLLYLAAGLVLLGNPVRRIVVTCLAMLPILYFGLPLAGISVPRGIFGF